MTKELFDLVSNEIWGHKALDYTNNYLTRRATWTDYDIRDEALYYEGLAHGIRSGQAGSGAFQRPIQPMIYGGMPTLGYSGNNYQYGYNPMASIFGNRRDFWTDHSPQPADLHPGFPTPCSKTSDMALGLYPPHHVLNTPPGVYPCCYLAYGAVPPRDIGRDASMGQYSPRPLNPVASTSHSLPSGTDARQGYPDAAQLYQMHMQQHFQTASRQDKMNFPLMPASQTSTAMPVPKTTAPPTTPYIADPQQIANTTAARAGAPGRAGAFGAHEIFGGKTPSIPLTDDQASHPRTQENLHHSASQIPAASPKETSALNATVEDPSEEDRSDEDYARIDSPSADSTKSMEKWFEEQAERDISHMSKTWW